jgi:hypothetical protein
MPCNDGGPPAYYDAYEDQRRRSDELARMLCRLCRRIEELDPDKDYALDLSTHLIQNDSKLSTWWKEHQEQDAKRLAAEKERKRKKVLRRQALKKLTAEEIEALDL